jgi:hypothetical protein
MSGNRQQLLSQGRFQPGWTALPCWILLQVARLGGEEGALSLAIGEIKAQSHILDCAVEDLLEKLLAMPQLAATVPWGRPRPMDLPVRYV